MKKKQKDNVDILSELPFYDELNIIKTAKAFKNMQVIALR